MTLREYLAFLLVFGFLALWTISALLGLLAPERLRKTLWGRAAWRSASSVQIRIVSVVLLLAGLAFLGSAVVQLANGTFAWKGSTKHYGFSDFLK